MKSLWGKIKSFFGAPAPEFHFSMNRLTSHEEQITVTFNGYKGDSDADLIHRVNRIGDILHARMVKHNEDALEVAENIKSQQEAAGLRPKSREGNA